MADIQNLNINDIPVERVFPTRQWGDLRELRSSIQNFGILQTPVLYQTESGLQLLDGAERVLAAKDLGLKTITCKIYSDQQMTRGNAFLFAVELNRASRVFNVAEKAHLIRVAHHIFQTQPIPRIFWQQIGVSSNVKVLQQYRDFLRLPAAVQKYAVNNATPLQVVLLFQKFPEAEREKVANRLFIYPINQNKLADLLTVLWELSRREEKSVLEILDEVRALTDDSIPANQKESELRKFLHKRRNPHYEAMLQNFDKRVKSLGLPVGAKLAPTPFFEDNAVDLQVRLGSLADVDALRESLSAKSWGEIFSSEDNK